ncbi:DUF916 and DUF3324 domain-containing protein [Carnobacterium sp.]|uniref:DUF916 and DUF3324 domain-containing protein n=1 Tax=Carnobacterium sp. TaxID=48221 RepID=UPI002FC82283
MKKFNYLIAVLCGFCLLGIQTISSAAETEGLSVAVSPILPENQIDKAKTYFDLLVEPGQQQELEVSLKNSSDKEIVVQTLVNTATTNDNGVVDYSNTDGKTDSTLKYPLSSLVSLTEEQKIPAKSEIVMKIKLQSPKEKFSGVLAGGLYISEKEDKDSKKGSEGVQIKNKYTYIVGIQLRNQEDISAILPKMNLDKSLIKAKQVNFRNYIGINLQNTQPVFIRKLQVGAKIYAAGSSSVLYEEKSSGLKMAPNSNFNFGVSLNNTKFKAGKYRAEVSATAEDYDKTWQWNEEFEISADDAKKMNDLAVELDEEGLPIWIYIAVASAGVLIIMLLCYIIFSKIKKKKEEKRRLEMKRRNRRKKKASLANQENQKSKRKNIEKKRTEIHNKID